MTIVVSALILCTVLSASLAADESLLAPPIELSPFTKLVDDIPTCRQSDDKINECIKQAFTQLTPRLKYGISDLNIPPLDPFGLDETSYNYNSGILQGRFSMRDVEVRGISEAVIDKVDYHAKSNRIRLDVLSHMPEMLATGAYRADIKLNDLRITPKGTFNITLTDISMKSRALGELYERDGHTYLRLTKFNTQFKVGDMRIYATGLVPDKALNDIILDFINQYWRQLYQAMLPETMAIWEPFILKMVNEFFAALPFDLLVTKA